MRNKLLSVLFVAFLVVSVFVSCSQESTIENLYHGEVATITFDLGPGTGTAPKKIVSNKGQIIVLPSTDATLTEWTFDCWTENGSSPCNSSAYTVKGNVTLTARWKKTITYVADNNAPDYTSSSNVVYYGDKFNLPDLPTTSTDNPMMTFVWKNSAGKVITADTVADSDSVGNGTITATYSQRFLIKYLDKSTEEAVTGAPVSDYITEGANLSNLPKISLDTTAANVKYVYDTWKVSPTNLVVTSATSFTSFTDAIDRTNHVLKLYADKKTIIALSFDFNGQGSESDSVRYVDITSTQKYLSATDIFGEPLPTATTNTSIDYWYLNADIDANKITSATDIKDTDIIVHAKWKNNTFTITYNANGGTGDDFYQTFTSGTDAKLSDGSAFSRTGYDLEGWVTTATDATVYTTGSNADAVISGADEEHKINLYAKWKLHEYKITYHNVNGATSASNLATFKMTTATDLNPLTSNTSIFLGWFTSETDGKYVTKVTTGTNADVDVWAKWFDKPDETNGPAMTSATSHTGALATTSTDGQHLTAVYIVGESESIYNTSSAEWNSVYVVDGKWEDASEGRNVYYLWAYNTYIVKFNENGGDGTTTMSDLTFTYSKHTTLTDNAFTRTGYTFNEWNTKADGTGTSYANKKTDTDYTTGTDTVTLYAQWTPTETAVTFTVDISGGYTTTTTYTYDSTATDLPFDLPTTASDARIIGYQTSGTNILYVTTGTDGFVWSAGETWKTTESDLTLIPKYQIKVEVITGSIPGTTKGKEWADEGMNTLDFVNSAFTPNSGTVNAYTDANFTNIAPYTVPHQVEKWTLYLKLE